MKPVLEQRPKESVDSDPAKPRKMEVALTESEFCLIRDCAAEMNITQRELLRRWIEPALSVLKHVRG